MKFIHCKSRHLLPRCSFAFLAASCALLPDSSSAAWLDGRYLTGDWGGARTSLEDEGIILGGTWKGTVYGIADGGLGTGWSFDQEVTVTLKIDLEKLAGWEGFSFNASTRWRDGENPNADAGASAGFNPSSYQVGRQWRLMPFYLTWTSRKLFPVEDMITISGGWQNPYHFFLQQPESKLFQNNAITQTKGIGANAIPFNGTYEAWGGYIKVKPVEWAYVQGGLYAAVPDAVNTDNHGTYLDLDTGTALDNDLYAFGEIGVTPKFGGLPGKYAVGAYYWGLDGLSYSGEPADYKVGFYGQADQMLYREPSPAAESAAMGKGPGDGKTAAPPAKVPAKSDQGLYVFGMVTYLPEENETALPLYLHGGLVYKGLIPGRDKDQAGLAFAYGEYSGDQNPGRAKKGLAGLEHEAVLEFDYRAQLTKFAYVQPFVQYIMHPGGTGNVDDAAVVGVHMGVTF